MMSELSNFLLPNEPTCIVACAAGSARFWVSRSRSGPWELVAEMHDEFARRREADFASDRPGRSFDTVGAGRHAMAAQVSAQEHHAIMFARRVTRYLNRAIADNVVESLVLIAAPRFLGYLRAGLSESAQRAIVLEEPRNLADVDEKKIRKYFE